MLDLLIRGGTGIDPESGDATIADVAVDGGRIAEVSRPVPASSASMAVEAHGLFVAPGFVDLHSHVNWRTSPISINPDDHAPTSGVTPWIDAGSAYATAIEAVREYVVDRSVVRVLAFLRLSHGTNEIMPCHSEHGAQVT